MDRLIHVSQGYIPNLGPLGPLLHVEKFVVVVVGGGWWWVVETNFCVKLESQAEQLTDFPFSTILSLAQLSPSLLISLD